MNRLVLVSIIGLVLGTGSLAAQDTLRVGVAVETSGPSFNEVRIPVWVDLRQVPGERLGGFNVRLSWADTTLFYRRVVPREFNNLSIRTDSVSSGILRVAGINVAGVDSVRMLFDLVLDHFFSAVSSPVVVQPDEMTGVQPGFRDLLATTDVVVTNGQYCVESGRWGDLDGDGFADTRDGLAVLSDVVGLSTVGFDMTRADVTNDGVGNSLDALVLVSHAVGLEIPGTRVLLSIAGACAAGTTPGLTLAPDTVELVPGQAFRPIATVADSAGAIFGGALNWRSLDPSVAVVDTSGLIVGAAAGTTGIIGALGPGLTDTVLVNVLSRRAVWHVNSPVAAGAGVQLGTSQHPFDDVLMVASWVSEGDTVLLAPGIHLFNFNPNVTQSFFDVGVVLMGDTTGGQPRPVIRARSVCCERIEFRNGGRVEFRNLELEGMYRGVEVDFLNYLLFDNVTVRPAIGTVNGIWVDRFVDTLRVTNSQFFGDTAAAGSSDALLIDSSRLLELRDVVIDGWTGVGIELFDTDSADVERTTITGPGWGIRTSTIQKGSVSFRMVDSHIETGNDGLYVDDARTVVSEHNVYRQHGITGGSFVPVDVQGPFGATFSSPRTFTSLGDSIDYLGNWYWSFLFGLDSIDVDSLWMKVAVDSLTGVDQWTEAHSARFANSQFLGLNFDGIYFEGRKITVDSSTFAGCAVACDWTDVNGIEMRSANDSGPQATIRNSSFFNMNYAIRATFQSDSSGPGIVMNNTIDSARYGIHLEMDSLYITDNVMTRIGIRGVETDRSGTNKPAEFATIAGNRIVCDPTILGTYGILYYDTPGLIQNNYVGSCYYGIWTDATTATTAGQFHDLRDLQIVGDTVEQVAGQRYGIYVGGRFLLSQLRNNTVRSSPEYGIYLQQNILPGDSATVVMDTNAVSGVGLEGIRLAMSDSIEILAAANNISNNLLDGIRVTNSLANPTFRNGQFSGNARWAVNTAWPFDADFNYWGDPLGPGGPLGAQGSTGDSVLNSLTTTANFLTAAPGNIPPLAPPPLPLVAADRTAVRVGAPDMAPETSDVFTADAVREQQRDTRLRTHLQRRANEASQRETLRTERRRDREQLQFDAGLPVDERLPQR